jgi:predicted amidophosphoribosyltransferase
MKNSFAVRPEQNLTGKNIIIVDDVVTTGSTLNETKKVLRNAGARKVVCVALAH